MININNIVSFLEEYKINNKFTYHKFCIDKFKEIKSDIHKIKSKPYILYGIRLYLLNNIDSYQFILSKYKYKECSYLKIKLDKKEKENFLSIIEIMETEKSNILKFNDIDIKKIEKELDLDDTIYFNIIENNKNKKIINYVKINN